MADVLLKEQQGPFDRCGLASLDDLETREWEETFRELELFQDRFLRSRPHPPEYRWPRDPLHTCLRVWEYPYVYHHVKLWRQGWMLGDPPTVVDLGSGLTFFPLLIAELGNDVIPIDTDTVTRKAYSQIIPKIQLAHGSVMFTEGSALCIPLKTGVVDCLYCISVLEHIPGCTEVIKEVARVLRPGGWFVLTFDVDLKGNFEVGARHFRELMKVISGFFETDLPEKTIHPLRVLTSENSPFPLYKSTRKSAFLRFLSRIKGSVVSKSRLFISAYGGCYRRKC